MNACPTPEKLRQLLEETLEDREYQSIEQHLEQCVPCREVLNALTDSVVGVWPPPGVDRPAAAVDPARSVGLYRSIRLHARGGLGEVFEVRDEQFQRPVALKVLQERHGSDPDSRRRFLEEATVTAQLEHPGIPPVHALAHAGDGRPCYTMRLVRGETLHEAVRTFHERYRPGRDGGERRLGLRQLLARFLAVCNTVAYAHSRGILHLDLKPANIMLGPFGETLVLDWGLAKRFREEDTGGPSADRPSGCEDGTGVLVSQLGGTPEFMSPEQAAGQGAVIGPASDVYSLGATLYHLLTGRLPFPSPRDRRDGQEVLRKVQQGEFARPRAVNRAVPPALEAVCLKAMALRPEERYATVSALAADLEQWMAGEPVSARPEPWGERMLRRLKRHRVLTTATAVGMLIALLSLAVATAMLRVSYGREQHARDVAERQRAKADRHLGKAVNAVGFYLRQVHGFPSDGKLEGGGVLEPLEGKEVAMSPKRQLESLTKIYRRLEGDRDDEDPSLLQLTGDVLHGMGTCYALLGNRQEAEQHYLQSLAIQEQLVTQFPPEKEYPDDLAFTGCELIRQYRSWGHPDKAANLLARINVIFESLRATPVVAERLAHRMAFQFRQFGPPEDALPWLGKAIDMLEVQHRKEPDNAKIRDVLCGSLVIRAGGCAELRRYAEAVKDWDRLLQLGGPPLQIAGDYRSNRLNIYAVSLAMVGDYVRATAEAEALAVAPGNSSEELYNLACVFALSMASVRHNPELPQDKAAQLAEDYAIRALRLLTRARDAGFFQIQGALKNFEKDTDFDPLRSREDFKRFMAGLKAKPHRGQP